MGIKSASKVERITEVTIENYGEEFLTFEEHYSDVGARIIRVSVPDPRVVVLDDLISYATPSEDECPPREVTLQSLIDELTRAREKLNGYNATDTPDPLEVRFNVQPDEIAVITSVLGKGNISYDVKKTVKAAVTPDSENTW